VTVVPITSNVRKVHPFQVLLAADRCGLERASKAQAEQVRSVSIDRIGAAFGRLPADEIDELDSALRLHLLL
jgi:mRNA interferase MazF